MTQATRHMTIAIAAASLTLLAAAPARAQHDGVDDKRTVVVEREYAPEINDAEKITLMPPAQRKTTPQGKAEYVTTSHPYDGTLDFARLRPDYDPMQPKDAHHGLIYAGGGSAGSAEAGFYYNPRRFKGNELTLKATFDGVGDGRKPFENSLPQSDGISWDARHYRTEAAADYSHAFDRLVLYVRGGFRLDNFNYRPAFDPVPATDKGRHTHGTVTAGIRSDNGAFTYDIHAAYSHFDNAYGAAGMAGRNSENRMRLAAAGAYSLGRHSRLGVRLAATSYAYTNSVMRDFTTVGINPAYTYADGAWNVRLGAHLDFATRGGGKVKAAPDVYAGYTFARRYTLYASAKGGLGDNGYAMLAARNPYWNPAFAAGGRVELAEVYKQLDADIGLKASPLAGLSLAVSGGYDIDKGDLCLVGGTEEARRSIYQEMVQRETRVIHGRIGAEYAHKDILTLALAASIMRWDDDGDAALALRPRYAVEASAAWQVIDGLRLAVSYLGLGRNDKGVAGNVNDLSAKLSYTFRKGIGIYVKASNLTGGSNCLWYAYPSAGTRVLGGVSWEF